MPSWVLKVINHSRGIGSVSDVVAPPGASAGTLQWPHWDFHLQPGTYWLRFVSETQTNNYFAIGTIPLDDQPEPIRPQDRFGVIANRSDLHGPVLVQADNRALRIESWVQRFDRVNNEPLPPSFDHWTTVNLLRFVAGPWMSNPPFSDQPSFGNDFHSLNRYTETDTSLIFAASNGQTSAFDGLIVSLAP